MLDRAESYRRLPGQPAYEGRELAGVTVANLFFEPSTRTRASFDLASRRLGAHVLNLDMQSSSRVKGETMLDTIYTLEAMNTDVFVIRDSEAGMPEFLIDHVAPHVSVISAGEAHLSHPTQGLLDVLTIRSHKRRFAGLKVAIVGDIKHSRVARSTARALRTLGTTDLRLVAPEALLPAEDEFRGAQRFTRIEDGIAGADVVMMLRIQKERMAQRRARRCRVFSRFRARRKRLKLASPSVLVMHPGPDESRRGDLLRGRRRPALGDTRAGQQRRRGAHGRARRDCRDADAPPPAAMRRARKRISISAWPIWMRSPLAHRLGHSENAARREHDDGRAVLEPAHFLALAKAASQG
jgi:aspartate carbamoyltransferase catalytic subunit